MELISLYVQKKSCASVDYYQQTLQLFTFIE